MAYILGKDLDNWDDSLLATAPYSVSNYSESKPQFMTGADLMRSARITDEWKDPVALYAQAYNPLTTPDQAVESTLTSAVDSLRNLPYNSANALAQRAIEIVNGEKDKSIAEKLYEGTELGKIEKQVSTLASLGLIIPGAMETAKEIKEKAKTYEEAVNLLNNRDYPLDKYAKRVIAETTDSVETRNLVRELYNQAHGIDGSKWYNQAGTIMGAMTPAIVAARLGYRGSRMFGASRNTAVELATDIAKGYIGTEMAGQYAEETAAQYLERTGDKNFENFTAKDASGLSAIAYGAIGAQIEFMGGIEPIVAGSLSKIGLRSGLLKAGTKIAAGESAEELLQGLTEILMRKMEGSTDKTWEQGFEEALTGALWGAIMGGTMGTTAFHINRRNLVKGIKTAFPNITDTQATQVADVMIDSVGEASTQDKGLWNNLRGKIETMYQTADIDNKADRIDAMTDLEYALIVADSAERGIDVADNPLFQGEVNPLGWFRTGVSEEIRPVVDSLLTELTDLQNQLKKLNESKEKDWEKIDEIERKLEMFDRYVLDKLGENAPASLREFNNELRKVEDRYVAKQKKKAGIPVDTLETTGKTYTDAEILGMFAKAKNDGSIKLDNWENVRWSSLLSAGDTYQKGKRNKPATEAEKAKFARKMLDKYMPNWNIPKAQPLFQDEVFKVADENARLDDIYPAYDGETIEVDGKERTVYNSNGHRIAKSKEALTNFWRWFGDSKVVDEQGRPLVVYHATNADFDTFDKEKQGTGHGSALGKGFYFSTYQYQGEDYGKNVMPVYLKIENPMTVEALKSQLDDIIKMYLKDGAAQKDIEFQRSYVGSKTDSILEMADFLDGISRRKNIPYSEILNKLGFDGIFFREQRVAFEPNQIKSVDNRGTFSADTGNIYWQNRPSGAAPSTYRGAYIPQYRFIQRTNKMDASTLSHELAHDWFETNFAHYRSGKATPDFMRAWGALEKALGITDKSTKAEKTKASEAFARAYEGWIMNNKNWEKFINVDDKDKDAITKLMQDYQSDLRDIYQDLTNPYFKQTWGKLGEMKPEIKAWFDKVVNIQDLDTLVERGEMTEEQASQEKLNRAIDKVIETTKDEETAETLKEVRTLNDTARYEVEGGNKNAIQERLSMLAREIDENNMISKGQNYDTRRDMMQVAEAADNFVKTRLEDALAIINGQMAEVEGLYKEDIYTALERMAVENADLNLLDELKNSEIANRLAKELGQRVAGFRNWKQSTDLDVVSALKSLDNRFDKALENKKAQKEFNSALEMLDKSIAEQDKVADKELESTLKELECK